jgi:hypothetical protein
MESFPVIFLHRKSLVFLEWVEPGKEGSGETAAEAEDGDKFARMKQVRHRSYATYSRQPRQVRKEATVTGSCVCSESPVPGLLLFPTRLAGITASFTDSLQVSAQESG